MHSAIRKAAIGISLGCLGLAAGGWALSSGAQQPQGPDIGGMLIQGLNQTEGCLGVEAIRASGGRNAIIAWFEDKAAARRWYDSETHQRMMSLLNDEEREEPMTAIPDGTPLMVIATITPSAAPEIPGVPIPIKQISIELFTPAPGGAMINGHFSPEGFRVEGMKDYGEKYGDG
ncbi:MAG: hypothetical protein AAGI17_05885 [Planctomycetota bacterium]